MWCSVTKQLLAVQSAKRQYMSISISSYSLNKLSSIAVVTDTLWPKLASISIANFCKGKVF